MRWINTPRLALLGLGLLVLASVTARTFLADKIVAPQLLCDEFIHAGIAKSLALDGHFRLRHEPYGVSLVYPALLAPAWRAPSMETVYFLAKGINALVMTVAAVPFFFWVRRLSTSAWALVATGLLLVLPAFNYTGMLMTENAFLTVFLVATFAIASSLENPTTLRQMFAVAAIAVSLGVRAQAVALVLVLPGAILLYALLDRSGQIGPWDRMIRGLRANRVSLLTLGGIAAMYAALRLAGSPSDTLGAYRLVFETNYSVLEGLRWGGYHLAELTLVTGVVPLSAFLILVGLVAGRSFPATPADKAFVAVAVTTIVAFIVEIGLFTSKFAGPAAEPGAVAERYSFYLGALLLIALVVWLHRGLPRPTGLTAASALVAAMLVLWLPLVRFTITSPLYSSFGLYAFYRLPARLNMSAGHVELIVSAAAVLALVAFALASRRLLVVVIPVGLALFFVMSSWPVFGALRGYAFAVRYSTGLGRESSWIEESLGRDNAVTYLYVETEAGQLAATRISTQAEFWNRNIRWVTSTGDSELCSLPEKAARIEAASGKFRPAAESERLLAGSSVVTSPTVKLVGQTLASRPPLVAYRIRGPLRLSSDTKGVYSDGLAGGHATYTQFEAPPQGSTLFVDVSRSNWRGPDVPGAVKIRVGTLAARNGRHAGPAASSRHERGSFTLEPRAAFASEHHGGHSAWTFASTRRSSLRTSASRTHGRSEPCSAYGSCLESSKPTHADSPPARDPRPESSGIETGVRFPASSRSRTFLSCCVERRSGRSGPCCAPPSSRRQACRAARRIYAGSTNTNGRDRGAPLAWISPVVVP